MSAALRVGKQKLWSLRLRVRTQKSDYSDSELEHETLLIQTQSQDTTFRLSLIPWSYSCMYVCSSTIKKKQCWQHIYKYKRCEYDAHWRQIIRKGALTTATQNSTSKIWDTEEEREKKSAGPAWQCLMHACMHVCMYVHMYTRDIPLQQQQVFPEFGTIYNGAKWCPHTCTFVTSNAQWRQI